DAAPCRRRVALRSIRTAERADRAGEQPPDRDGLDPQARDTTRPADDPVPSNGEENQKKARRIAGLFREPRMALPDGHAVLALAHHRVARLAVEGGGEG